MASLSPFTSTITSPSANFLGTLVSNLLLPSSHERQNCQSNSSGPRRLNRGNCCTPKFALAFFHQQSQLQAFPDLFKLAQESDKRTFLVSQTKIRVSLIFQDSGLLQIFGLGFWLILAQLWSGECSFAFNQELRFYGHILRKVKIPQHFASYSEIRVEFALFF